MKLALISVYDKTDIIDLCEFLFENDYKIISTGGTYNFIINHIKKKDREKVISVENFTGFPEVLNGRVKTLHPRIYSGILFDPNIDQHCKDFKKFNHSTNPYFNLERIDVVVVNLYPFKEMVKTGQPDNVIIENIDIGGISLLRAAAKNYQNVTVLCKPKDYIKYMDNFLFYNNLSIFKKELALKAFEHVTDYDMNITHYFDKRITYRKYTEEQRLKYGTNPYQNNAFISRIDKAKIPFEILNGIPGYINYLDAFQSWLLVNEVQKALGYTTATSFKHTSPAGVAISKNMISDMETIIYNLENYDLSTSDSGRAFIRARNSDAMSSFGDFIAISSVVDKECASLIKREVSDGIIAKEFTEEALQILSKKKGGKYIILKGDSDINYNDYEYREIFGVALTQKANNIMVDDSYFKTIPTENNNLPIDKKEDLILATITLKYTPSNSIVIADNGQVIGVGAGQQNRVDCIKIAGNKAQIFKLRFYNKCIELLSKFKDDIKRQDKVNAIIKYINNDFLEHELNNWKTLFKPSEIPKLLTSTEINDYKNSITNLVLSSDAFFPFRDNIDYAQRYGIKYILNPGGSIQDQNIIDACNNYSILMAISGKRLFLH
jgi:phosphoribosylaminoimidazolecarboxamide formyltransferase / IMP cyclohydrolase